MDLSLALRPTGLGVFAASPKNPRFESPLLISANKSPRLRHKDGNAVQQHLTTVEFDQHKNILGPKVTHGQFDL